MELFIDILLSVRRRLGVKHGAGLFVLLAGSAAAGAAAGEAPASVQTFTVVNSGEHAIWRVHASPTPDDSWGEDRLGEATIPPGGEHVVPMDAYGDQCRFDVKITGAQDATVHRYDVDLCEIDRIVYPPDAPGGTPAAPAPVQSFTVVNSGEHDVWTVHASPTSDDSWGEDRLGMATVPPGGEHVVPMDAYGDQCRFDVRIAGAQGAMVHRYDDVDLCEIDRIVYPPDAPGGTPAAPAPVQSFTVVNSGEHDVWTVHASPTSDDSWGEDRLGMAIVPPGGEHVVPMDGYGDRCRFDVRIAGPMDTMTHEYDDVDLCEIDRIVYPPDADDTVGPNRNPIVGTAFLVSADGMLMTNWHVVEDCGQVVAGDLGAAREIASDEDIDVSLLRLEAPNDGEAHDFARFRSMPKVRMGEEVVVFGYPLGHIMSRYGTVAKGVVGALSGHKENVTEYQIMVPIHPGNSGSPLLDRNGHVIGVVTSGLTEAQSIGYATKADVLQAFLETHHVRFETAESTDEGRISVPDIVDQAIRYTVPVRCG